MSWTTDLLGMHIRHWLSNDVLKFLPIPLKYYIPKSSG